MRSVARISRRTKHLIPIFFVIFAVSLPLSIVSAAPRSQADCPPQTSFDSTLKTCVRDEVSVSPGGLPHQSSADSSDIKTGLQILFGIVGALALLFITISGLRYVVSGGNPDRAARAKDGIIYALVGLVIAVMAEAIVSFVVRRV